MMILTLAFRNIRKNFRRSLLTILAISMGLAVLILSVTLRTGQYEGMINSGVSQLAGHVIIQKKGYHAEKEVDLYIDKRMEIHNQLTSTFPDATITTRSFVGGLLTSTSGPAVAALNAIDPIAEKEISDFTDKVVEGEWIGDNIKDILIGINMAETLAVEIGDKLVFTGSFGGEMNSQLFRVKGIFKTGASELDAFVAFVNIKSVEQLMQKENIAHQLAVHLPDVDQTNEANEKITSIITDPDLEIMPWPEALPDIVNMIKIDEISNESINVIIFIIVAMGILNTMLMSVLERTREFGVILAIGLRPKKLAMMVLAEGFILGVIGAILGLIIGVIISYPLVVNGLDLSAQMGEGAMIGDAVTSTIMYGKYNWTYTAVYMIIAVGFSVLSAAYPAWKLTTFKPVEAMRHH
jgi:ABC-type lipoprotein release transport system permease subunit